MIETVNKIMIYLNKLSENKTVVIEKDDVNSVIKSREAFLCANG
ncbi:hypothetical protein SAMN04487919_15017 [Bacillus sp. ok061]|nr:hypothetical protein [Bacillus sp. ok061]SEG87112.1 hypothetical protein SAMN04487919_15017 [Bacillus sp. ok061]